MKNKDFYTSQEVVEQQSELPSFKYRDKRIIGYLSDYLDRTDINSKILDIGESSKLTTRIQNTFWIKLDNTIGDLDITIWDDKYCYPDYYDFVIFSHVIEHLFNPLFCLENIKRVMKSDALLIICTPIKPHFLPWGRGHFHEMDEYRFRKLMERAGLKIVRWEKFRRGPFFSNLGIRPMLRKIFFKDQSFVVTKIK